MFLLNGVFTGFVPNATALIASQVPKDKSGAALGTLSTGEGRCIGDKTSKYTIEQAQKE